MIPRLPRRFPDDSCDMPPRKFPLLATGQQPVIDVLVLYTKNALLDSNTLAGDKRTNSQMETDIASSYQEANNALAASGVDFSIRIVRMLEVLVITLSAYYCNLSWTNCGISENTNSGNFGSSFRQEQQNTLHNERSVPCCCSAE